MADWYALKSITILCTCMYLLVHVYTCIRTHIHVHVHIHDCIDIKVPERLNKNVRHICAPFRLDGVIFHLWQLYNNLASFMKRGVFTYASSYYSS